VAKVRLGPSRRDIEDGPPAISRYQRAGGRLSGKERDVNRYTDLYANEVEKSSSAASSRLMSRFLLALLAMALFATALAPVSQAAPSRAELPGLSTLAAAGTGKLTSGSKVITEVNTTAGTFEVGRAIYGTGIIGSPKITAVGPTTLELSLAPTETKTAELVSGFEKICGATTDPTGNLYLAESGSLTPNVKIYDASNPRALITEFSASACGLAVDSAANVYAVSPTTGAVTKYKPSSPPPLTGSTTYSVDTAVNGSGVLVPNSAQAVAVDPSNQHVFVAESQANEIQKFTKPTTTQCGGTGTLFRLRYETVTKGSLACGTPTTNITAAVQAVIDELFGPGNAIVTRSNAEYTVTFGGALSLTDLPSTIEVIKAADESVIPGQSSTVRNGHVSRISSFLSDGTFISKTIGAGVSGANYSGVDVYGSNGRVYAVDGGQNKAYVFNPAGTEIKATINGSEAPTGAFAEMSKATLAVDQSNGNVLVSDIKAHQVVDEFNAAGKYVDQIAHSTPPFVAGEPSDVAVDNSTVNKGKVYVTSGTTANPSVFALYAFGALSPTKTIATTVTPPASGSVDCNGSPCEASYAESSSISLEATAASGFAFKEWKSGTGSATSCNGSTSPTCVVQLNANTTLTAEFKIAGNTLKVAKDGSGAGTVTSAQSGSGGQAINCGAHCEETFSEGASVTLSAAASAHSKFSGWHGADAIAAGCDQTGATATCGVTMSTNKEVTATFDQIVRTFSVNTGGGTGAGSIECKIGAGSPAPCAASYPDGTQLTLVPVAGAHSQFRQFENGTGSATGCSGATCIFTIEANTTVDAPFDLIQRSLSVNTGGGTGTGEVKCNGGACQPNYPDGTTVTLTVVPGSHSAFAGWSVTGGASVTTPCTGTTSPCEIKLEGGNVSVAAPFNLIQRSLTVNKFGSGSGTVECKIGAGSPGACASSYAEGTQLSLIATAAVGSEFKGFSNGTGSISCTGTGSCTVTIEANSSVDATFDLEPGVPGVTGVSPNEGPAAGGNTVEITGGNLESATKVEFGTTVVNAPFVENTATKIKVVAPAHAAGQVDVKVTTAGGTSANTAADDYTFASTPAVTALTPNKGPTAGGNTVEITGTDLSKASKVEFGTTVVNAPFVENTATKIKVMAPAHAAGQVDLKVTTAGGTSVNTAADDYTFVSTPSITGVLPVQGPADGGNTIEITGTDLSNATKVEFGTTVVNAPFVENTATKIKVVAPAHAAGQVDVKVTTAGGTSANTAADDYTYVATSAVTGISPNKGSIAGGNTIEITGTDLSNATKVEFGTTVVNAPFVENTATKIKVVAPARAAGQVDVKVTTAGGTSANTAADDYTYFASPTVTGLNPSKGPTAGGTVVTITGTNLSGATEVKFGSTAATGLTPESGTQMKATAPAGTGTVDVSVTTPGGTSANTPADDYTYFASPTVTGLNPSKGPTSGGTVVTIAGTNLSGATEVKFGSTAATGLTLESATQMKVTSPPGTGMVDVRVTTPGGTSATNPSDLFTYVAPPTITGLNPSKGPTPGGTVVTITGTNLSGATEVKFGSISGTGLTPINATQLKATAPAQAAGAVDVSVTTVGGTSANTAADNYTYELPTFKFTVNKEGSGDGAITCDTGSGPGACASSYPLGTTITLAQTPNAHTSFGGWSGCDSESAGKCVIASIDSNRMVSATFTAIDRSLTVKKAGSGSGTVSCNGGTCTTSYGEGTTVTLTAAAAAGSTFAGWSGGGCSGTGSCKVTLDSDTTVTATFDPAAPPAAGQVKAPAAVTVKNGMAPLELSCKGGACSGKLKLTAKIKHGKKTKKMVIGQASFSLGAGESKTVNVKLAAAAKKLLNEGEIVKATLSGPGVKGTVKLKPSGNR
jgi:hypothetical protein